MDTVILINDESIILLPKLYKYLEQRIAYITLLKKVLIGFVPLAWMLSNQTFCIFATSMKKLYIYSIYIYIYIKLAL